jgi:hypothetical protein
MRIGIRISILAFISAAPLLAQTPNTYGRTRYDPLVAIINQVPSFGGMWWDKEGNFHGSLANLNDSSKLRTLLDHFMEDRRRAYLLKADKRIIVDEARYSYAQLYKWQCQIEGLSIGVDGFQSIGVREDANQVHVGVIKPEAIEKVLGVVRSLKIPLDAVIVEVEGKIVIE